MSETVIIGGREFRIGATYAPKPKPGVTSHRRKTLLRTYRPYHYWQEPMVEWRNKNGSIEQATYTAWAKWAGDEVQP